MEPAALALIVYSIQILVVVCVASLAATLCRLSDPTVRLAYWRGVGALCLALPLFATARPDARVAVVTFGAAAITGGANDVTARALVTVGTAVLWLWGAGVVARLGWLAVGALGLRRLRRHSVPALLGDDVDAVRRALAPRAEFLWSLELTQPVTYGMRRPVVLLPARFGDLSADGQIAVACHELLHVTRRDWIWIVLEEHARALFWFHPAVWWLVEQVQLAREQIVDQLVIDRTAAKRAYMSALLTFADGGYVTALSSTFLRRRHLQSRLRQLSKEPHMSLRRLVWTTTALTVVMGCAAIGAVRALPLDLVALGQGRAGTRLEIRLAETAPAAGLIEAVASGSNQRIYLHPAPLATDVDVTSARVIDMGGSQFGVAVTFNEAASARMLSGTSTHLGRPMAILFDGEVISAPTLRAPIRDSAVISGITADSAKALAARLAPPGAAQNTIRPDGVVLPVPVRQVRPEYTAEAMAAGIEGSVLLDVVVLRDGSVGDVTVARSLDSTRGLDQQAVQALKQWEWKAGTKDGKPETVAVKVEMTFTLK
jgi:TonB family protein